MKPLKRQPTPWLLLRIWSNIGIQSFGGGASTTFLIQQTFIQKYGWLTLEEYNGLWNLCVMTPGINLIAVTILIGRKLGGVWGVVVSVAGLLLPSAFITCLLTAGFLSVDHLPAVQAMLKGIIPATSGIMLLVALRFAYPLFKNQWNERKLVLLVYVLVILAATLALIVFQVSVVVVIIGAALLGAGIFRAPPRPSPAPQEQAEEVRQP